MKLWLIFLLSIALFAQAPLPSPVAGAGGGGGVGGVATSIMAIPTASLPATCAPGDIRTVTDATTSAGLLYLYGCPITNTWVQIGYTAGPTGMLTVTSTAPGRYLIDANTARVPDKTAANTFSQPQTFTLGSFAGSSGCTGHLMTAGGTIAQFTAVQTSATGVVVAGTGSTPIYGIAQIAATIGQPVSVCVYGPSSMLMDATVAVGELIVPSTSVAGQGHTVGAVEKATIAVANGIVGKVTPIGNCTGAGCTGQVFLEGSNQTGTLAGGTPQWQVAYLGSVNAVVFLGGVDSNAGSVSRDHAGVLNGIVIAQNSASFIQYWIPVPSGWGGSLNIKGIWMDQPVSGAGNIVNQYKLTCVTTATDTSVAYTYSGTVSVTTALSGTTSKFLQFDAPNMVGNIPACTFPGFILLNFTRAAAGSVDAEYVQSFMYQIF